MKAMILAAGFGTRLRPWTLSHPKALVPVDSVPMLERVILKLKAQGFDEIIVNVHHFANQIIDFLNDNDFGVNIVISDESSKILDTGGGILRASGFFEGEPVLIHNVDILSDANLSELMSRHIDSGNDVTLLTSGRESSRQLLFDNEGKLRGWHNTESGEYRPQDCGDLCNPSREAFSGIYIIGNNGVREMEKYSEIIGKREFPIMDFLLTLPYNLKIRSVFMEKLNLIDIGKPAMLELANDIISRFSN